MTAAALAMDVLRLVIRKSTNEDLALILDTYRKCRADNEKPNDKHAFADRCRATIAMLIARGADFVTARFEEDKDTILGWAVAEKPVLHFVYVRAPYRRQGVALSLLAHLGMTGDLPCTCWNSTATAIALRRKGSLRYIGVQPPKHLGEVIHELRFDPA